MEIEKILQHKSKIYLRIIFSLCKQLGIRANFIVWKEVKHAWISWEMNYMQLWIKRGQKKILLVETHRDEIEKRIKTYMLMNYIQLYVAIKRYQKVLKHVSDNIMECREIYYYHQVKQKGMMSRFKRIKYYQRKIEKEKRRGK